MKRCPTCGVASENADLHETALHTESSEASRPLDASPASVKPEHAAPSEKPEGTRPTPAECCAWVSRQLRSTGYSAYADRIDELLVEHGALQSATAPLPKLLEIVRHNESIDESGDPVGPQPETQWEVGYCAGIRCLYRFLSSAVDRIKA